MQIRLSFIFTTLNGQTNQQEQSMRYHNQLKIQQNCNTEIYESLEREERNEMKRFSYISQENHQSVNT